MRRGGAGFGAAAGRLAWLLFGLVALACAAGVPGRADSDPPRAAEPAPSVGGPFRLKTHRGTTLSDADLRGTPYVIFFGFTHCPDVCPTALWELSQDLAALGPDGDRLKVLFVTVDPERDTEETLATYLESFDPRIVGLIGSPQETEQIALNYKVFYRKVPLKDGGYTMEHSAALYLMGADGRLFNAVRYQEAREKRLAELRALLRTAEGAKR